MRVRITFSKTDAMRYTSHLDLHRTLERTIRRAGLPLSYSQGFNPRPKLVIAAALPLGITGQSELLEFWLDEELPAEHIAAKLKKASPPGVEFIKVEKTRLETPKLPNLVNSVIYEATLLDQTNALSSKINELLSANTLIRTRKAKTYDLRPLIYHLEALPEDNQGQQRICMELKNRPGETGRPDELISALHINPNNVIFHRKAIILHSEPY